MNKNDIFENFTNPKMSPKHTKAIISKNLKSHVRRLQMKNIRK